MRYSKPHVVNVLTASQAVQMTGSAPNGKNLVQIADSVNVNPRSTTGAYEADE